VAAIHDEPVLADFIPHRHLADLANGVIGLADIGCDPACLFGYLTLGKTVARGGADGDAQRVPVVESDDYTRIIDLRLQLQGKGDEVQPVSNRGMTNAATQDAQMPALIVDIISLRS
jgi:hypothetical protein